MIKFVIRKDVYDYLVEKGFGKKDYGKLQKVQRPDKNGVMRTIYVNPSEEIENEEQMGKQEVEVKEKTSKLKVPDETSSFAKNTKSKDFNVGQEINFSSQGREDLNGKVTAIGVLGVTVKGANGKIYTVNYDEIKK